MAKFGPMVESCSTLPSFFVFSFLPKCKIGTLPYFWFCRFTRMSFLPENLTPASLRSCHRKVISHSDGHSILRMYCRCDSIWTNKKSRLHRASEIAGAWLSLQNDVLCNRLWRSKSGSASYSSRQQNQRRGGAVRHFRYTDTVSDEPTNYVSIWSNISIQLLCSGVPLCHYYTDNVLWRQACKAPHCILNHRERKSTVTEKVLLLVMTFSEKYQRAKIILSNLGRILRINFPTTCREYKTHFQPSWSEV